MRLILISLNYAPELTGIGKYNAEMCEAIAQKGIDVRAIVGKPYYPEWKIKKGYSKFIYTSSVEHGVSICRCPLFVPSKPNTIKRLIHLITFAISSGLALLNELRNRPNIIFVVQPTLLCAPIALIVGKITGAKTILHIQDFEVDAMLGLNMAGRKNGKFSRILKTIESWIMNKFDSISTISLSMLENAQNKGIDNSKLLFFPNWSDTSFITPSTKGDSFKKKLGFNKNDRLILYSGNIGNKQGLEIVLNAAQRLNSKINAKFVFVGSGSYVETLKEDSFKMGLSNVFFFPLVPWEEVPELLAMADIHLVVQKKGIANAVLPSKLTNILAAGGHAIVSTDENAELGKIASEYPGIFQCVEPEDSDAFVSALLNMLEKDLSKKNLVARRYAEQYLSKDSLINKFIDDIKKI